MPRITLPDGARGVAMDGTDRYTGRPGDTVTVSAGQAAALGAFARSRAASGDRFVFGTRRGRHCPPCARVWNSWSVACPRCGAATVDADAPAVSGGG